jgi:phosphoglucomutase
MKIKKITENYILDNDGDISEEYAKLIISKYIDDLTDGKTLQDSFDFYCEELEDDLRYIISQTLLDILQELYDSREIQYTNDYYIKKKARKYNI